MLTFLILVKIEIQFCRILYKFVIAVRKPT